MIIRQLEGAQYDHLCEELCRYAHMEPMEAFYTVELLINGKEYSVRVQPECGCKMAVLQAYEVMREEDGIDFITVTEESWLTLFLDALLVSGVPRTHRHGA